VLLDECLPRKLKHEFVGHEAVTVTEAGWAGLKNGALLRGAEEHFDVFVTVDRNLRYQQNLATTKIRIIVLAAENNRLPALRPLIPRVLELLPMLQEGGIVRISAADAHENDPSLNA
jgi:predicted nuclease of predicted toxin-antitoxin system